MIRFQQLWEMFLKSAKIYFFLYEILLKWCMGIEARLTKKLLNREKANESKKKECEI